MIEIEYHKVEQTIILPIESFVSFCQVLFVSVRSRARIKLAADVPKDEGHGEKADPRTDTTSR